MTTIKDLKVDPPVEIKAFGSRDDRRYIDDQIRAVEQHLVDSVLKLQCTWYTVDQSVVGTMSTPMCAAMSGLDASGNPTIVLGTGSNAKFFLGIAMTAAQALGKVLVAVRGALPPSVTGISNGGVEGYARVNTTTGLPEFVTTIGSADLVIGRVNAAGMLMLLGANINYTGTGGGGGGGSVPTGTGFTHITSGAQDGAARAVNLASADVTGVLPTGNQAAQALSGDASGTTGAVQVNSMGNGGILVAGSILRWPTASSPSITHLAQTTDTTPNDFLVSSGGPFASAVTNKNSANLRLRTPAPVAGGTAGSILFQPSASTTAAIVPGALQFYNVTTPYNAFSMSGTAMTVGDVTAGPLTLQAGAGDVQIKTNSGLTPPSVWLSYASGAIYILSLDVGMTNSLSGSGIDFIPIYNGAAQIKFGSVVASATVNIDDNASAAYTGAKLSVIGQNATGSGATVGGDIEIGPGSGATKGNFRVKNATVNTTAGAGATKQWHVFIDGVEYTISLATV